MDILAIDGRCVEETGGIGWSSYQKLESSSSMSPRLEHADAKWKRALSDREDCPLASWGGFSRADGQRRSSFRNRFERYSQSEQER